MTEQEWDWLSRAASGLAASNQSLEVTVILPLAHPTDLWQSCLEKLHSKGKVLHVVWIDWELEERRNIFHLPLALCFQWTQIDFAGHPVAPKQPPSTPVLYLQSTSTAGSYSSLAGSCWNQAETKVFSSQLFPPSMFCIIQLSVEWTAQLEFFSYSLGCPDDFLMLSETGGDFFPLYNSFLFCLKDDYFQVPEISW